MIRSQLVRKSFNGGELTPALHFRNDLEVYHNACKTLKNMIVTPWGAVQRRAPAKLLHTFDTAVYGVPVKYVPFRFSLDEVYHIVFTDGSGSASPGGSTADMLVLDESGNLQDLDGVASYLLETVYDPADLDALQFIQVNDFIYMTCAGKYPVQLVNRFFDSGAAALRWKTEEFALDLGPFGDVNSDSDHTLTLNVEDHDDQAAYSVGDVVKGLASSGGGQIQVTRLTALAGDDGTLVETSAPHGLQGGDSVNLSNLGDVRFYQIVGLNSTQVELEPNGGYQNNYNGTYIVQGVTGPSSFYIGKVAQSNTGGDFWIDQDSLSNYPLIRQDGYVAVRNWYNHSATVNGVITSTGGEDIEATYVCVQDVPAGSGIPLSNTAYWQIGGSNIGVQVAEATIESSNDLFIDGDDIGRLIAIKDVSDERLSGEWNNNQVSNAVNGYGSVKLTTRGGAWGGFLELQQSTDGVNWETLGSIRSENGGYNGSIEREINGVTSQIRVKLTDWSAPTGSFQTEKCVWELEFSNTIYQTFKIKSVTDARNAVVTPVTPLLTATITSNWKLGEFSPGTGYPRTLSIYRERMIFGGSELKPNTVWASRINDWQDFILDDLETSPFSFTIASDSYDEIQWVRTARELMIGSDQSESIMNAQDSSIGVTATNVNVATQTYYGSANIQAVVTADLVFYVQGQARRVRSSQYDFGTDQYLSSEMSIYADHITAAGIKEMTYSRDPFNNLFFTLSDGTGCAFTYERDNMVKGWSSFELGASGLLVSAASNYSESGDILGMIVKRGSTYTFEVSEKVTGSTVYLDSQVQFVDQDYSAGVSVPYSSDADLVVVHDDVKLDPADWSLATGTLTVPGKTSGTLTVGYPFEFVVEPTDVIEFGDFGPDRRPVQLSLYLKDSGMVDVAINGKASRFKESINLGAGERLNGENQLPVGGGTDSTTTLRLSGSGHQPFTLLGVGFLIVPA